MGDAEPTESPFWSAGGEDNPKLPDEQEEERYSSPSPDDSNADQMVTHSDLKEPRTFYEAVKEVKKTTHSLMLIGFVVMIISFVFLLLDYELGGIEESSIPLALGGIAIAALPFFSYLALEVLESLLKPSPEEKGTDMELLMKSIEMNPTLDGRFVKERRMKDSVKVGIFLGILAFMFTVWLLMGSDVSGDSLMDKALYSASCGAVVGVITLLAVSYNILAIFDEDLTFQARVFETPLIDLESDNPVDTNDWSFYYLPLVDKQTNKVITGEREYHELYWEAMQSQEKR